MVGVRGMVQQVKGQQDGRDGRTVVGGASGGRGGWRRCCRCRVVGPWLPLSYAYSQAITSTSVLSTQEYP